MSWVVLLHNKRVAIARHNAMMFGSCGSVLAWDRLGELVRTIVCNVLKIPALRWVDDYFGVEHVKGTTEHVKDCFARIVRAMLGPDAIETAKLEHGNPLTILGTDVKIEADDITLWPTDNKISQWVSQLKT